MKYIFILLMFLTVLTGCGGSPGSSNPGNPCNQLQCPQNYPAQPASYYVGLLNQEVTETNTALVTAQSAVDPNVLYALGETVCNDRLSSQTDYAALPSPCTPGEAGNLCSADTAAYPGFIAMEQVQTNFVAFRQANPTYIQANPQTTATGSNCHIH